MRVPRALLASCGPAVLLSGCYWLAQYGDLSSAYGDGDAQVEGGGDTQPAPDAGPPFCPADAGALAYCMDFDGVDVQALGLVVNDGSAASIVNGPYVSPPSSLRVTLEGPSSYGRYAVSLPLRPTTSRLEFEIQGIGVDEGVTTLGVTLVDASTQTSRALNVVVAPDGSFQVQEFFAFADGGTAISPHAWYHAEGGASSAWYHVVLTLAADDATHTYTSGLTVNGEVIEDGQSLSLPWAQGDVTVNVGVTFAAEGGTDFYFDNVRADFTP